MSFTHRLVIIAIALLSASFIIPAQAKSACKGLTHSSCDAKSSCIWVDGYTRKDNKKVKAHCRTSPGHKSHKSNKQKTTTTNNKPAQKTEKNQ